MGGAIVKLDDAAVPDGILVLKPGANLRTGERDLASAFGSLTSLEQDLLTLAAAIYACDIAFKRGEREDFTRSIQLDIPVVNQALLRSIQDKIVYALYKLSDDVWEIEFTNRSGTPEAYKKWPKENEEKVLLFSGGVDSFAAAVQLGYSGDKVHLVSHITANRTVSRAQDTLFGYLETNFPGRFCRSPVRVGGVNKAKEGYPFPSDLEREDTQRTRSFLFLTLAGIVARRIGTREIIMIAENGQLAIHLPLTAARISAFSTHTAHPEFVDVMSSILQMALSHDIRIQNPYLYMTKAEVVSTALSKDLNMIERTISCWRSSRLPASQTHCGSCIPCLIRRIANEFNGVMLNEYGRDIFSEDVASLAPDDDAKRNFVEMAEFVRFFEQTMPEAEILMEYPELVNENVDAAQAIGMYQRFAKEARSVFNRYPHLSSVVA